jgi:hypothetical protein
MKKLVIAAVTVFSVAGVAVAGPQPTAVLMKPGQAITYGGMTCTAYTGTRPSNANLVCVRNNLHGYGVIISQEAVIVAKQAGSKFNIVWKGKNG